MKNEQVRRGWGISLPVIYTHLLLKARTFLQGMDVLIPHHSRWYTSSGANKHVSIELKLFLITLAQCQCWAAEFLKQKCFFLHMLLFPSGHP